MNNNHIFLLLHIIKNNGNINRLIREGINLTEIHNKIISLLTEDILSLDKEEHLSLTIKGIKLYNSLYNDYKIKDKDKWIEEEKKSKIDKIDKNFIFLPNQNDLHF